MSFKERTFDSVTVGKNADDYYFSALYNIQTRYTEK